MKLSKLEAYRVYLMNYHMQMLSIRLNGDREAIVKELDLIWEAHCSKIANLPKSCPTLVVMKGIISESTYLQKYFPV